MFLHSASLIAMGKAIVLILIALGANVYAEDMVAASLVDRASNNIVFVDMDNAVLAKEGTQYAQQKAPVKAGGNAKFTPIAVQKKGGRVFGGTNNRNNNDPAVMAKLKGKAQGMYGTMGSNLVMSGGGPKAWDRFGAEGQPAARTDRKVPPPPQIIPFANVQKKVGRVFGGTNNRNNKDPAVMAKLRGPAAAMYSDRPMSYEYFGKYRNKR